jgi:hypothetical protein
LDNCCEVATELTILHSEKKFLEAGIRLKQAELKTLMRDIAKGKKKLKEVRRNIKKRLDAMVPLVKSVTEY